MVAEIRLDIASGNLYYAKQFAAAGREGYPRLLTEAATQFDDDWLAAQLSSLGMFELNYARNTPSGGRTVARVPRTAPQTFAEGEFNRFYLRGLCLRAMDEGKSIEAYRAKAVMAERSASVMLVGTRFDPKRLLADLRANPGVETALGLPVGPNSGLSGKLVS
jgi:hypothetical protein